MPPCLFSFLAEYILQNARLEEAQARIKMAGRNISNFRYANDSTNGRKWRGTKEPLDEGERGEWKIWLKTQHSKNEDHGYYHYHLRSWIHNQGFTAFCAKFSSHKEGSGMEGSPYLLSGIQFSSVQSFSRSVVSDSLRPRESQLARPPCSSQTPAVYLSSCWRSHSVSCLKWIWSTLWHIRGLRCNNSKCDNTINRRVSQAWRRNRKSEDWMGSGQMQCRLLRRRGTHTLAQQWPGVTKSRTQLSDFTDEGGSRLGGPRLCVKCWSTLRHRAGTSCSWALSWGVVGYANMPTWCSGRRHRACAWWLSQPSPSFHPQLRSTRQRGERRLRKGGQEKRSEGPGEMEVMEGAG